MRNTRQGICLWAVVLFALANVAHAQSTVVTPEDEYKKLIRVNEDIQPLGEHPFGENISLYDGSLSFQQTDASLSGDGPALQFSRKFQTEGYAARLERAEYAFGDWSIELPHLETFTGSGYTYTSSGWRTVSGWQVNAATTAGANARCSQFAPPPDISEHTGDAALVPWTPDAWWKGYHLVMPGGGGEDLLANLDVGSQGTYPVVTKNHWRFSCLAATANGEPGEGFLAQAPDGTRYWFNQLVYRYAPTMSRPLYEDSVGVRFPRDGFLDHLFTLPADPVADLLGLLSGSSEAHAAPTTNLLNRKTALMLVTRIEDRFGNALTYSYDANGNLTGITASDGRTLTVQYVSGTPRIHSVTLQPAAGAAARIWTYAYSTDGTSLTAVTLPDGSQWHYDLVNFDSASLSAASGGTCTALSVPANLNPTSGTVTHPSGLTGVFTIRPVKHGRSYVPRECRGMANGDPLTQSSYAAIPDAWYGFTVTERTLSGADVAAATWSYNYSPAHESWDDCGSGCPTTVTTDVINPDGSTQRNTFSNRYDYTESQLLRTDYYTGAATSSTLLRSEISSYAPPGTAPLPASAGGNLQEWVNWDQTSRYSPLNQRVIEQDGDRYTWQAESFDVYAQVTQTKRFNSITSSYLEETTSYLNDTSLWVLGLPLQVTNVTNAGSPEIESLNTYDPSNDTLLTRARFGQTLMHYAFNSAGQLASFTDGNTHTTTLGNYKRGIPQTIGYPDSTSESLIVDDFGQIGAITDQAGHTTSYAYDPAGRITQVSYPTGDEVAWYPTHFTYDFVASAERGIAANHWRRTVTTGNASTVTYFDAMLRPLLSDTSIIGTAGSDTSTASGYDAKGQTIFSSYPVAGTPALSAITSGTHHFYDALGRPTQSTQDSELGPLTSLTAYLSGARRQVTGPKGNVTTTSYQVFDEPGGDAVIKVQAPTGITQTIARDLYGNPLSITQSGVYGTENDSVTKTLSYDIYHRLCRSTEPESGSTVMHYDAANNLDWSATGLAITGSGCGQDQVAADVKTARTYDAMNRVLTISPPTGTQGTTYTYDIRGHVASASSGISLWWANYDTRGNITGEALWVSGQNAWGIGYSFDAYNHLSAIGYPGSPAEGVAYAPDALGRATQAGGYASGVQYYPDGTAQSYMLGNGISALIQKNARLLPSGLSYARGGTQRLNEAYVYDKDANLTNVTDLVNGQNNQTLGYDGLNRLTSAIAPNAWGTQSYAYDALNNLRQNVNIGYTINMNIDASNRLTSVTFGTAPFSTFQNDVRGNRSAMTYNGVTTQYSFDAKNQLLAVPGVASYAYDAAGRRIMKTPAVGGAAAATYSFYNHAGQLMFGYDAATAQGTNYIYLNGKLIARHKGNAVTYLLTDRLGSPVREADASGNVTASFSYAPYGGLYSGPNQSQPGFTGHVNDPETAFTYMQARYYDAGAGHMLSVDPVGPTPGDVFGFNRYAYANNNPYQFTDPDGRSASWIHRRITMKAALKAGMTETAAKSLANKVVKVDKATQSGKAEDTNKHGMAGTLPDGTMQTKEQALTAAQTIIDNPDAPLEDRLHALQDVQRPQHHGKEWKDPLTLKGKNPISEVRDIAVAAVHIARDMYISKTDEAAQVDESAKIITSSQKAGSGSQ